MLPVHLQSWWNYLRQVREFLFGIFIFFLPFTQALTFHIGFPLKVSELALLSLVFLYLIFRKRVQLPKPIIYLLSLLFFLVTISELVNLLWTYPYPLKEYPSRFGYNGDSITRYIYFILALFAFYVSIDIFSTDIRKFCRIWLYGAMTAAIIGWYLAVFSALKLPVLLLPGMENPPQKTDGGIIRCGTFLEGNYMGLYLLLSASIAFYIKRFKTGFFLILSIITTFSTLSIIAAVIFLILFFRQFIFRKKYIPYFITGTIILLFLLPMLTKTNFYRFYVYEKLFSDIRNVTNNAAYSKADRLITIQTAFEVSKENIFLGVGLSNFGRHYEEYYKGENLSRAMYLSLLKKNSKVITNNIYIEVLSETGIFAFLVFISFLVLLLYYAGYFGAANTLLPALLGMFICFNAYPSFIMIYLWSFMALPVVHYLRKNQSNLTIPA